MRNNIQEKKISNFISCGESIVPNASIGSRYLYELILFISLLFIIVSSIHAQEIRNTLDSDTAYIHTITQRAEKIVATLNIMDKEKQKLVQDIVAGQYRNLRILHENRNNKSKAIKADSTISKTEKDTMIKRLEAEINIKLRILHEEYLVKLGKELTVEQIDKIKDGMTYGKVQFTYGGYIAMIPGLTGDQKKKIMDCLIEAREIAMDAESSEKKTAIFGKYKGRIANYLSKEGYDLKKEQEEWNKRIKATNADTVNKK